MTESMIKKLSDFFNKCTDEEKDILMFKFSNEELGIKHKVYDDASLKGWYEISIDGTKYMMFNKINADYVLQFKTEEYRKLAFEKLMCHSILKEEYDFFNKKESTPQIPIKKIQYALLTEYGYLKIILDFYPDFEYTKNRKTDCDNFFKQIEKDKRYNELAERLKIK